MGFAALKELPDSLFASVEQPVFSPSADGDFYDISPENARAGQALLRKQQTFKKENLKPVNWSDYQ
jgi:hypothetical protein